MIKNLQHQVIDSLDDLKGLSITTLDVRHLTCITDYMIICTGTSSRHVKSLANHVICQSKALGHTVFGYEGEDAGEWVLIDLGDVIVHIMQANVRDFYKLEKLWDISTDLAIPLANHS